MTAREFLRWLNTSRKGQSVTYHVGNLHFDRQSQGNPNPDFRAIDHVGDAAYEAHQKGKVALVQRRVSPGVCAYVAQRL